MEAQRNKLDLYIPNKRVPNKKNKGQLPNNLFSLFFFKKGNELGAEVKKKACRE